MSFKVYYNSNTSRVWIQRADCGHLQKNGGTHNYNQGGYSPTFDSYHTAEEFATAKATEIRNTIAAPCSFCKPE